MQKWISKFCFKMFHYFADHPYFEAWLCGRGGCERHPDQQADGDAAVVVGHPGLPQVRSAHQGVPPSRQNIRVQLQHGQIRREEVESVFMLRGDILKMSKNHVFKKRVFNEPQF